MKGWEDKGFRKKTIKICYPEGQGLLAYVVPSQQQKFIDHTWYTIAFKNTKFGLYNWTDKNSWGCNKISKTVRDVPKRANGDEASIP